MFSQPAFHPTAQATSKTRLFTEKRRQIYEFHGHLGKNPEIAPFGALEAMLLEFNVVLGLFTDTVVPFVPLRGSLFTCYSFFLSEAKNRPSVLSSAISLKKWSGERKKRALHPRPQPRKTLTDADILFVP